MKFDPKIKLPFAFICYGDDEECDIEYSYSCVREAIDNEH